LFATDFSRWWTPFTAPLSRLQPGLDVSTPTQMGNPPRLNCHGPSVVCHCFKQCRSPHVSPMHDPARQAASPNQDAGKAAAPPRGRWNASPINSARFNGLSHSGYRHGSKHPPVQGTGQFPDPRTQRRMGHQTHLLIMRISESEPRIRAPSASEWVDNPWPTPGRTPQWRAGVL